MSFTQLLANASRQNQLLTALIELTYTCNLKCSFCYNDLSLRGRAMTVDDYRTLIDDLVDLGTLNLTLSGGEPMLHPDFFAIGAYAKKKRFSVTVKTNGLPLTKRNISRLIDEVDPARIETSLHGASAHTHDRLTRVDGSFERLIENVEKAVDAGLKVTLNCPLTCYNEAEVGEMYELADKLNVNLKITPEISPRDDGDTAPLELRASPEGIANMYRAGFRHHRQKFESVTSPEDNETIPIRTPQSDQKVKSGKGTHKICGTGSSSATIDPYGNVYPCVQLRRKIGNLHEQSIARIWNGDNETLTEIRQLAVNAYDVAQDEGLGHFCMGTAELKTGNPLVVHKHERESAILRNRIAAQH